MFPAVITNPRRDILEPLLTANESVSEHLLTAVVHNMGHYEVQALRRLSVEDGVVALERRLAYEADWPFWYLFDTTLGLTNRQILTLLTPHFPPDRRRVATDPNSVQKWKPEQLAPGDQTLRRIPEYAKLAARFVAEQNGYDLPPERHLSTIEQAIVQWCAEIGRIRTTIYRQAPPKYDLTGEHWSVIAAALVTSEWLCLQAINNQAQADFTLATTFAPSSALSRRQDLQYFQGVFERVVPVARRLHAAPFAPLIENFSDFLAVCHEWVGSFHIWLCLMGYDDELV